METNFSKTQATRRRTLFPLSSWQVHAARVELAYLLDCEARPVREIRQILNLSGPEQARRLVAQARRKFKKINGGHGELNP